MLRDYIIYVSGPYTEKNGVSRQENIHKASYLAARIWDEGFTCLCPHANTTNFEEICKVAKYDDFLAGDLRLLNKCDAIFMMPRWKESKGAYIEREWALEREIPIFYNMDALKDYFNDLENGHL